MPLYGWAPRSSLNAYRSLHGPVAGAVAASATANTYIVTKDGGLVAAGAAFSARGIFFLDPADYTISGFTAKPRFRIVVTTNNNAPGINFTGGLYPVSSVAGTGEAAVTVGTVTSGSTAAVNTPGADTLTAVNSGDFTWPAAGKFVLAVATSGTNAANAAAEITFELQMRWV